MQKEADNNVSYEILKYISESQTEVIEMLFYGLHFYMIRYRYLSVKKRNEIKNLFHESLHLDTAPAQLKFMKATRFLDSNWEKSLARNLKTDSGLEMQYIEIVNSCEKILKSTVDTICTLHPYAMSSLVNEKLFEYKKFKEYIVSKVLGEEQFILETGERLNTLWEIYLLIISGSDYPEIREYMANNSEFLMRMMDRKEYVEFHEDNRMYFSRIYQDADCLKDVLKYGEEFALKYYLRIAGFKDKEAATTIMQIIEQTPILLKSKELYDHMHPQLVNGPLKTKYTILQKKHA